MNGKKKLRVTSYGVWGFVFAWFGIYFFAVNILGLVLCVIGLAECATGKKRGIGWPLTGLSVGFVMFITFIGIWKSLNEIQGYWVMNIGFLGIIFLFYMLFRHKRMKTDGVTPDSVVTNLPFSEPPVLPSSIFPGKPSSGTSAGSSPAAPAKQGAAPSAAAGSSPSARAKVPAAQRPDPETMRNEVKNRTDQLKEKLLEQEARRILAEEESEQMRRLDESRRKEFREKILASAAEELPSEPDLLTQDGQRLIYEYAMKIFPQKTDSEAGMFLMKKNIEDAETMIETVSGVMESLSEKILESGSELRDYWKKLDRRDLIRGIKAFTFYKEMSVGSEPFEFITDELIGHLYDRENA